MAKLIALKLSVPVRKGLNSTIFSFEEYFPLTSCFKVHFEKEFEKSGYLVSRLPSSRLSHPAYFILISINIHRKKYLQSICLFIEQFLFLSMTMMGILFVLEELDHIRIIDRIGKIIQKHMFKTIFKYIFKIS